MINGSIHLPVCSGEDIVKPNLNRFQWDIRVVRSRPRSYRESQNPKYVTFLRIRVIKNVRVGDVFYE